jgi:hypothetical protein
MTLVHMLVLYSSPGTLQHKTISIHINRDLHLTVTDHDHYLLNAVLTKYYESAEERDRSPIFNRVTHMRLVATDATLYQPFGTRLILKAFTRLSHISVSHHLDIHRYNFTALHSFLNMKSLRMLVVTHDKDVVNDEDLNMKMLREWMGKTRKTDDRVYLLGHCRVYSSDHWEEEMRGGESIWDQAISYTRKWDSTTIV